MPCASWNFVRESLVTGPKFPLGATVGGKYPRHWRRFWRARTAAPFEPKERVVVMAAVTWQPEGSTGVAGTVGGGAGQTSAATARALKVLVKPIALSSFEMTSVLERWVPSTRTLSLTWWIQAASELLTTIFTLAQSFRSTSMMTSL